MLKIVDIGIYAAPIDYAELIKVFDLLVKLRFLKILLKSIWGISWLHQVRRSLSLKVFFCISPMMILWVQVRLLRSIWITILPLKTLDNTSFVLVSSSPLINKTSPSFLKNATNSTKSSPSTSGKPPSSPKSSPESQKINQKKIILIPMVEQSIKNTLQKPDATMMTMSFEVLEKKT